MKNISDYSWYINRQDEAIYVTIHLDQSLVACYSLREGHLAFKWSDDKLKDYLIRSLK